jgi:DNA mismatch repair protein MutS2
MDEKTLHTLEYLKILETLAGYCAFTPSAEKARGLQPTTNIDEARQRQAVTSEGLQLLVSRPDLTIGGARDVRESVDLASHGGVLTPVDFLDIKFTMIAARNLGRLFDRLEDQYPHLYDIASQLPPPLGLIDTITSTISDRGEILDTASDKLGNIRRDLRIAHDRLLTKMQRMVSDPKIAPYLQDALVTQRDDRYVLPLRAEFKGRINAIVHDQSSSGATLFVEPVSVVEHNNRYRELQLAERDEERRIMAALSQEIGMLAPQILLAVDIIAELDMAFARAKYAEDLSGTEPILHTIPSKSSQNKPGTIIRLIQARHPLLAPDIVVPIDVEFDPQTYALVITGPNTGGKTVTLKTVGLLSLMAQSGLHIPTHSGSEISVFENVFADIGDEQSIEQSLSTFSGHITNIIRIFEQADQQSLILLDELGAGTDPQEGAALARALLNHILDREITTLVTTHHPELKAYAHTTPGVINASVEFDLDTLRPTYHLTIGLPGRSNALAIAERLGMPNTIVNDARTELNPQDLQADDLLDEIHRQRDMARQARAAAEMARQEAESLRVELSQRLEHIEDERRAVLEEAHNEAEEELLELREEVRKARRSLAHARQPLDIIDTVEGKVNELEENVEQPIERRSLEPIERVLRREIRLGDNVRLRTLNTKGTVTSLGEEEAEVQVGVLRIRARLSELEPLSARQPEDIHPETKQQTPSFGFHESPGIELDLRGQRSDEALDTLDSYLDSAYLAGLPWVRIIHGKGTGKLRKTVRDALRNHPHVKSFEPGGDTEGGEGVTVAKLRIN